jgi:hypothetical protein
VALSTINQIEKNSLIRVLTQLAIDKGNKISTILSIKNSVTIHISLNRIDGVMVSMLASNLLDGGYETIKLVFVTSLKSMQQ